MAAVRPLAFLYVICVGIRMASSATDPSDVGTLQSLMQDWENTPPSWKSSGDPCGKWEGIGCIGSRVTSVGLSTMGLKGTVSGDIAGLTELIYLDLSYNPGLTGTLSSAIGKLQKLTTLVLIGCHFTGRIPDELGDLSSLTFLALNSNNFTGSIPASLGKLTNLVWLDLADNQLTGSIPVTKGSVQGLDKLYNAKHFHFNKNQLSGVVPETLFSSQMHLIHVNIGGVGDHGQVSLDFGQVVSWDNNRWLVMDTAFKSSWDRVDELDCVLGHDYAYGSIDVLEHNISITHQAAGHVLAVTRITHTWPSWRMVQGHYW
uniref:Leucine-rich repeat-containing N-terminal plant-type domain-containing protein n=1 Tax=Kalanchoe fedtschenkoi TaxID=63787 RepID=A0A7N1A7C7_KALFE